ALHRDCSDGRGSRQRARRKYSRLTELGPFVPFRKSSYGFSHPPVAWIGVEFSVIHAASALGLSLAVRMGSATDPVQRFDSFTMSTLIRSRTTKSWRNLRPLFSPRFTSDSRSVPSSATFKAKAGSCVVSGTKVAVIFLSPPNGT